MTASVWFFLTLALYGIADQLYVRAGQCPLLHPVLLPVVCLISLIKWYGLETTLFIQGTSVLHVLLGAAAAALALPLYRNLQSLKKDPAAVLAALVAGSVAGAGSAVAVGYYMAVPTELMASLATKSITTPIAIEVSSMIGGVPSVSAALVVSTGLVIAVFGPPALRLIGIDDDMTVGLAMGTAGHGLGMAEAVRRSDVMAAAAAFSMAMNGLLTALLLPVIWQL